jgi:phospholipase/carboxylesterase
MIHKYIPGKNPRKPTLLLLHGTGGNENDLLPVAQLIDPEANVLSVRGEVIEQGMPRFFRRIAPGVFDEEDLLYRTTQLHEFVDRASKQYEFDRDDVIAVGYSNGANIAASMVLHIPQSLKGAILMHPMLPRKVSDIPDLSNMHILITAGNNDPIVPKTSTEELYQALHRQQAEISLAWFRFGHKISSDEMQIIIKWYQSLMTNRLKLLD